VIPPKESARFVWRMEEVLDLYEEPYDPKRPVVCFDERPCQLLAEVREPLRLGAGRPERRDHEYLRRGMAHLFVAFEPLTGWRGVEVRERRRGREFAEFVRHLAEDLYPEAEKIRLVVDNLNIHTPASFCETFNAGARLVVEHGRDRDLRLGPPVCGQATRTGRADAAKGDAGLVRGAQPAASERRLALHHCRRSNEAPQALSIH
jgi:hypothetical protein